MDIKEQIADIKKVEFKWNVAEVEAKWQKIWEDGHVFEATTDYSKPKFYGLIEFPYPSGNGLHVGHPRSNTAIDIIARKFRVVTWIYLHLTRSFVII